MSFKVYVTAPNKQSREKNWILLTKRLEGGRLVYDHRQSSGTTNRREAERRGADHERFLNSSGVMTFADVLVYREEQLLAAKKTKTADAFRFARQKLEPLLGAIRVDEVTRAELLLAQDQLALESKPRTINTYFSKAAAAWRWLHKRGLVPTPWPGLDPLPTEDPDKRPYTDAEVTRILAWVDSYQGGRWRPIVGLCAETGRRVSEVCQLRGEDVDYETHTLRVRVKGGQILAVPILSGTFANLPRVQPGEWIFKRAKKGGGVGPASTSSVLVVIRKAAKSVGIVDHRRVDTHSFRRYACGALTRAEVPLQVAMRITGHRTVRMFTHYQDQWVGDDLEDAVKRTAMRREAVTAAVTAVTDEDDVTDWAERDSNPRHLPCKGPGNKGLSLAGGHSPADGRGHGKGAPLRPFPSSEIPDRVAALVDFDVEMVRRLLVDDELRSQLLNAIDAVYGPPKQAGEAAG